MMFFLCTVPAIIFPSYYVDHKINVCFVCLSKTLQVMVNNKQVYPIFKNVNYIITSTGMEVTVSIPEIQAQVTYTGNTFNIDLPFSEFQNNTEGLCGE